MPASAAVCELLELPALSSVYQIRRARRVDGRLVLYVEHYLNAQYFPGILGHDLTRSLTELYASEYGIHYGRVRFDMVPTALHAEAAAPLKVAVGSPASRISRINRDQRGRLIDCDLSSGATTPSISASRYRSNATRRRPAAPSARMGLREKSPRMFILPISSDLHLELLDQPRAEELFRLVRANSEHLAPLDAVGATDAERGRYPPFHWRRPAVVGGAQGVAAAGSSNPDAWSASSTCTISPRTAAAPASATGWRRSAQGRGLLARALGKTIEQGFGYDRQRLVIRCSTENLRSQRAAERQGFRRDGVIRANEIIAGRAHDHAIYTLLRSEWHAAHA